MDRNAETAEEGTIAPGGPEMDLHPRGTDPEAYGGLENPDTGQLVAIGKIGRAHGLKGEVTLRPISDVPERFKRGERYFVGGRWLVVRAIRPHKQFYIVGFGGIDSPEEARRLTNSTVYASPQEFDGYIMSSQLIGKLLVDSAARNRGRVVAIEANPASDLMVLEDGRLVPVVFVQTIGDETIQVSEPPGLFEI